MEEANINLVFLVALESCYEGKAVNPEIIKEQLDIAIKTYNEKHGPNVVWLKNPDETK